MVEPGRDPVSDRWRTRGEAEMLEALSLSTALLLGCRFNALGLGRSGFCDGPSISAENSILFASCTNCWTRNCLQRAIPKEFVSRGRHTSPAGGDRAPCLRILCIATRYLHLRTTLRQRSFSCGSLAALQTTSSIFPSTCGQRAGTAVEGGSLLG